MWNPDEKGVIKRSDRVPDTPPGISRFTECVLHQGRIERFFLDHMKEYSNIEVERGVLPESLEVDEKVVDDNSAYPITVKLRHLSDEEATPVQSGSDISDGLFRSNLSADDTDELIRKSSGREGSSEILRAKYMVGCDGAHSWTRRQLGFELEGEATDYIWGVLGKLSVRLSGVPLGAGAYFETVQMWSPSLIFVSILMIFIQAFRILIVNSRYP